MWDVESSWLVLAFIVEEVFLFQAGFRSRWRRALLYQNLSLTNEIEEHSSQFFN
ncbi:MAG: hypothetical protein ACTSVI_09295 [Promethearchaeota archaeon]